MKVLIVDDNDLLCQMMARRVSRRIFDCHATECEESALSEVGRNRYDLVFLDIHLPGANGLDLLPKIKKISPDTKVVVMSSDGSESNVRQALSGGALKFLQKPFDISDLDEILEAVLSLRRT